MSDARFSSEVEESSVIALNKSGLLTFSLWDQVGRAKVEYPCLKMEDPEADEMKVPRFCLHGTCFVRIADTA